MRQTVLTEPEHIEFIEAAEPDVRELGPHQILAKIMMIGICGSEIHSWHGTHPATFYPVVQGHGYSAVVTAVGSEVTACAIGDRITARPQLVCGKCGPCKKGRYNVCEHLRVQAFQADGAARDYFVIDDDRVVKLPSDMAFEYGAMVEPAAVGVHAVSRAGDLKGMNVVVSGAGTIGNLVAQSVIAAGAKRVLITDVSDCRLEIARRCGISETLNVATTPLKDVVGEIFGDEGFQTGFEVAGAESSLRSLMECVEKGGTVVAVGVFAADPKVNMFHLGEHELNIVGTMMYLHEDFIRAVKGIYDGSIVLDPLITNIFPFEKYADAYKFIDDGRGTSMKVLIDLRNSGQ